mmetsp:Transcript_6281/g.5393  ORF Transcript_6281/g.5393 Transcript_6281/m.5393 type:complete len:140 (+) Transcript_6281:149-568(+)
MDNINAMHSLEEKYQGGLEGYPDDGNGVYSANLSYGDWFQINVMKRIKSNNTEQIGFFAPFSMVNGLFFPYTTSLLVVGYIAGRQLYSLGYMNPEADMNPLRMAGSLTVNICSVTTILLMAFAGLRFYGFGKNFLKFIK